jgi:hypothetical protein
MLQARHSTSFEVDEMNKPRAPADPSEAFGFAIFLKARSFLNRRG